MNGYTKAQQQRRKSSRVRKPPEVYHDDQMDQFLNWAKRASLAQTRRYVSYFKECPSYEPSLEEFQDFFGFMKKIDKEGREAGLVKIRVPEGYWGPCRTPGSLVFPTRLQPIHDLNEGKPIKTGPQYTFASYKAYADKLERDFRAKHPELNNLVEKKIQDLKLEKPQATREDAIIEVFEDIYWQIQERGTSEEMTVHYANDLDAAKYGSAFNKLRPDAWDLTDLARMPESLLQVLGIDVEGMSHPWLYYGCLYSTFCWHVEDHYLYSINYMHAGAPKTWYGLPGNNYNKLENTLKVLVPKLYFKNPDLLHQLTFMMSPSLLYQNNIEVVHTVQRPGDLVITWPQAFHSGFSHGWNCAEAVNFAPGSWLPSGRLAAEKYADVHSGRNAVISYQEIVWNAMIQMMVPQALKMNLTEKIDAVLQRYFDRVADHHSDFNLKDYITPLQRSLCLSHVNEGPLPTPPRKTIDQVQLDNGVSFGQVLKERCKSGQIIFRKKGFRLVALAASTSGDDQKGSGKDCSSLDSRQGESTDVEIASSGKRGRDEEEKKAGCRAYRVVGVPPLPPAKRQRAMGAGLTHFMVQYKDAVTCDVDGVKKIKEEVVEQDTINNDMVVPGVKVKREASVESKRNGSEARTPSSNPLVSNLLTLQPSFFNGYVPVTGYKPDEPTRAMIVKEFQAQFDMEMRVRQQLRDHKVQEVEIERFRKAKYVSERYLCLNNGQALLCDVCGFAPYFSFGYCPCRPNKARCIQHLLTACQCPVHQKQMVTCVRDNFLRYALDWLKSPNSTSEESHKNVFKVLAWELCRRTWRKLTDQRIEARGEKELLDEQDEEGEEVAVKPAQKPVYKKKVGQGKPAGQRGGRTEVRNSGQLQLAPQGRPVKA